MAFLELIRDNNIFYYFTESNVRIFIFYPIPSIYYNSSNFDHLAFQRKNCIELLTTLYNRDSSICSQYTFKNFYFISIHPNAINAPSIADCQTSKCFHNLLLKDAALKNLDTASYIDIFQNAFCNLLSRRIQTILLLNFYLCKSWLD